MDEGIVKILDRKGIVGIRLRDGIEDQRLSLSFIEEFNLDITLEPH